MKPKRAWTSEEDDRLIEIVSEVGPRQWESIAFSLKQRRTGKQCRERWNNQLTPLLKKNLWTSEERWVLFLLQKSR